MNPVAIPEKGNLLRRLIRRGVLGLLIYSAVIFGTARSFDFWQAWAYMILEFGAMACFSTYFYRNDRQVMERRMLRREPLNAQKFILWLWKVVAGASFVLAGCDHRFGWSREFLEPVPVWLEVMSLLLILGAHVLNFQVLKANRFAASVIQIEAGQSVAATGPYRFVRHPMYVAFAVMGLFAPLALGSFVALAVSAFVIPVIIFRLLNEEKLLQCDLPGYADYCRQTRYRLIPFVW